MAFLITVETHELTNISVSVLLFLLLLDLHCVGGASRGLLFVSPFLVPFFFFLASLLGRLAGFGPGRGWSGFFYLRPPGGSSW